MYRFVAQVLLLLAGEVFGKDVECKKKLELMILQDTTGSFYSLVQDMEQRATNILDDLKNALPDCEVYATATGFSDKPSPFRGYGGYGGAPSTNVDYCYDSYSQFSTEPKDLANAFNHAWNKPGNGGDLPENPYEAMIYAATDKNVKWSPPWMVFDEDNRLIVRVMLMITDDRAHYEGDANIGIQQWNPDGTENWPHFWSDIFCLYNPFYPSDGVCDNYTRLIELHDRLSDLSNSEKVEYSELLSFLGPEHFDPLPSHPGTTANPTNCHMFEYPSLQLTGEIVKEQKIFPVVVLSGQAYSIQEDYAPTYCSDRGIYGVQSQEDWVECLKEIYTSDLSEAGFETFSVVSFDKDVSSLIAALVDTVHSLTDSITCPGPTTEAADFTTLPLVIPPDGAQTRLTTVPLTTTLPSTSSATIITTASSANTPVSETNTDEAAGTTITEKTDTAEAETPITAVAETHITAVVETTNCAVVNTTTAPAVEATDTVAVETTDTAAAVATTDTVAPETLSTDSTDDMVVPPPVVAPPPSGTTKKTAVIAGATSGAVAGVAALGALAYKAMGMSILGGPAQTTTNLVDQVDMADSPVEREAFEEVNMDMFQ